MAQLVSSRAEADYPPRLCHRAHARCERMRRVVLHDPGKTARGGLRRLDIRESVMSHAPRRDDDGPVRERKPSA